MTTLIDVLPLVDDATSTYPCDTRETALDTLGRIARSTGARLDVTRAGVYTAFVPGWLHILYDLGSRTAWLCDTTIDGRLATVQAVATWEA